MFYYRNASAIVTFLKGIYYGVDVKFAPLIEQLVGRGWFMPGMSFLLAPIQLIFDGSAPSLWVRFYSIFVNIVILYFICVELIKANFPIKIVYCFLVSVTLVPYYLFYLSMIWADLVAVHSCLLLFLVFERKLLANANSLPLYFFTGILIALIAYLRPQYSLLIVLFSIRILLYFAYSKNQRIDLACLKAVFILVITSYMMLLPWHLALKDRFGPSFMIAALHEGPLFKNQEFVTIAKSQTGHVNPFYAVHQKLMEDAKESGVSLAEQAASVRAKMPKKSFDESINSVQEYLRKFYFQENVFIRRFISAQKRENEVLDKVSSYLPFINTTSWLLLLITGLFMFAIPIKPMKQRLFVPLFLKGGCFLIMMQPLFSGASGRYYIALVPLFSLLIFTSIFQRNNIGIQSFAEKSFYQYALFFGQIIAFLFPLLCIAIWTY